MKKLLLLFVFINSYWAFGQLTYSFDAEYYWCGNSSQYCMPNTNNIISTNISGEPFDIFEWTFGGNYGNFRNTPQYSPKIESFTMPINDEFELVYHYEYFNELYTLGAKAPPRSLTTQYCSLCDYQRYYPADTFNGSIVNDNFLYYDASRYRTHDLGIMKGRISFQDRTINWHYETARYRNSSQTSKTQDYLVIKLPILRKTGSNCYNSGNYSEQEYQFADNINERDYCIECSVVTGGIAYDGVDDVADGHIELKNFRPNDLVISRTNNFSTDILAGEEIHLEAKTPAANTDNTFPDFVYNWQYSTDGGVSWQDVPNQSTNGNQINKTSKISFTMQQMLGNGHTEVFGPIDFRLGYGTGNRAFTSSLHFNYIAGAPVASIVEYVPPKCSGDVVESLAVYFDRQLQPGETFAPLQIVPYPKPSMSTPMFSQALVTSLVYDPIKDKYKYSFTIKPSDKLKNNVVYAVEYQAKLNGVPKGTLVVERPFTYNDPPPLTFSLAQTDPLCHNEDGKVTITAHGGSGEYYYYSLDGGTNSIPFTNKTIESTVTENSVVTITRTGIQDIILPTHITNSHTILVTDGNQCIEKTLNQ